MASVAATPAGTTHLYPVLTEDYAIQIAREFRCVIA